MIGKLTRYKIDGNYDSPPLIPDPDGDYLKIEEMENGIELEIRPGEGLTDAIKRHIDNHSGETSKTRINDVSFNAAMGGMIAYTLKLYLGEDEIVDGSKRDKEAESLFNSIKSRARRFSDDDPRAQFIAGMERCVELLKGG